jgi:large subunit ribosomal protein L9
MANTTDTTAPAAKTKPPAPQARTQPKAAEPRKAKRPKTGTPRQPGAERRRNHPVRAKHGYIQLILTQAVAHVGQSGDVVTVRPGYARNFLVPQGLATFATQANLRLVEKHRQRLKQLEEARRAELQNLAAQIAQRSLTIEANANAEGHLYGSVNADQIAESLKRDGFTVTATNILIEGPLKELGLYSIKVRLAPDIESELKLWVVPTHGDLEKGEVAH